MKRAILTEAAIYGIAGAIAGIVLTFVLCGCLVGAIIEPVDGTDASDSRSAGEIFAAGMLLGPLYFWWYILICGAPLGFLLGALVGAFLVLTEPTTEIKSLSAEAFRQENH
jgi:hypothetical protein